MLADQLGERIVAAGAVNGGFSPCFAGPADLADGRRVFIKAVSTAQNPDSPVLLRHELEAVRSLPGSVAAPQMLALVDEAGWVAGAFEYVNGTMPPTPWRRQDLDRALEAVAQVNGTRAPDGLPTARSRLTPVLGGWRSLADAGQLDGWASTRIDRLMAPEAAALDALDDGRWLLRNDVRADNMLFTSDHAVVFVDWAHACSGPRWLDVVLWLPPLQLEGGGEPDSVLARAPGLDIDDDTLTAVYAAMTGYVLHRASLPYHRAPAPGWPYPRWQVDLRSPNSFRGSPTPCE